MPGTEAHGGYTFCGFASLVILDKTDYCDLRPLLVRNCSSHYFVARPMSIIALFVVLLRMSVARNFVWNVAPHGGTPIS